MLESRRVVTREDLRREKPRFRSAFVFAILCQLDRVRCEGRPMALALVE